MWKYFSDFCDSTSITGFHYFTEKRRPLYERVLWLLGMSIAITACALLIRETWQHFISSPVIVSMDDNLRPVWEVPFPAITVCPIVNIDFSQFNFTDVRRRLSTNATDQEKELYSYISLQCIFEGMSVPSWSTTNSTTPMDYLEKLSIQAHATFDLFSFRSNDGEDVNSTWKALITDKGLCFTFNMLPGDHIFREKTFHASRNYLNSKNQQRPQWSIDDGYPPSADAWVVPYRSLGAGEHSGAWFLIKSERKNIDRICTAGLEGFYMVLHSPAELPVIEQQAFLIPLKRSIVVTVTPRVIATSEKLRLKYSPEERKCYFSGERYLRYFKQYTRVNCEIECLSNITFEHCKCVAYYMPRALDMRMCGHNDKLCLTEARVYFQLVQSGLPGRDKELKEAENLSRKLGGPCNCKQSCTSLSYNTHLSMTYSEIEEFITELKVTGIAKEYTIIPDLISVVTVYYEDNNFIPMRRMELYGTMTLIANCGGVLGLCLGMSIMSVIELLYWILVRPLWRKRDVEPCLQTTRKNDGKITLRVRY